MAFCPRSLIRLLLTVQISLDMIPWNALAQSTAAAQETAQAHVGKGYEDLGNERYRDAAEQFQAALALDPHLIRARYQLAVCYFALGRRDEARKEFEKLDTQTAKD